MTEPLGIRPRTIVAIAAIVVAAYALALANGFVWDDRSQILGSDIVQGKRAALSAFTSDFWALGGSAAKTSPYYRPLVTLSFWVDARLGGGAAWMFHLTNLLLHLVASLGVFAVARRFRASEATAWIAAALFAAHPAHLESVAWVSGRTDVLAAAFLLWALVVRGPLGLLLGACALLSKESALCWPLLAAVRDRSWRPRARIAELIVVAAVMFVRWRVLGPVIAPGGFAPLVALVGLLHGLGLLVAPWLDAGIYVAPLGLADLAPGAIVGAAMVASIAWFAWRLAEVRAWAFALAATLVPVALTLATIQVHGVRMFYLPSAFVCLTAAAALTRVPSRHARWGAVAALLGTAMVVTALGARAWRSDLTYWERAARRGSPVALINLAAAQHDLGAFADAWQTLGKSEGATPLPEAAYLRGLILMELGCREEAARAYTRAIELSPRYLDAWTNLAAMLRVAGRPGGAIELVVAARAQGIDSPALRNIEQKARASADGARPLSACGGEVTTIFADPERLNRVALDRGREEEPQQGLAVIGAALRLRPDWADAYLTKAQLHYLAAQHDDAIASASRALELDPGLTRALKPLGLAALARGDVARGKDALGRYLAAHPSAPDADDLRRRIR